MLLFIWWCVVAQVFMPGGAQLASLTAASFEDHVRAQVEAPQPIASRTLVGAASHVTRYAPRKIAAGLAR